ncbi:MAG: methyltransferase, partial [Desulfovibrio sp.]|nr:methyltransferase [Desulfovibrio sp.]
GIDLIAASELLYLDSLHRPHLKFLSRHLASGGKAVFCTDMARRKPHFTKLAAKEFKVEEVYAPTKMTDAEGKPTQRLYSLLTLEK